MKAFGISHIFKKIILALVLMPILAACNSKNEGQCVYDWDFSNITQDSSILYPIEPGYRAGQDVKAAKPEWHRMNLNLKVNQPLYISASGIVDLCGGQSSSVGLSGDGFKATEKSWRTVPGFQVKAGEKIEIVATGSYSMWGSKTSCDLRADGINRWNSGCLSTGGRGLLVQVSSTSTNTADLSYTELFDYAKQTAITTYTATTDGYLQFKHADHDTNVNATAAQLTSGNYADNVGGYITGVSRTSCSFKNGEALYGYVGKTPPDVTYDFERTPGIFKVGSQYTFSPDGSLKGSDGKGKLWLMIIDVADKNYTNNTGSYHVSVASTAGYGDHSFVYDVIEKLIDPVKDMMGEVGEQIFKSIVGGPNMPLVKAIVALLVLYILFSCVGYMFGLISVSQYDLLVRIVKISIVATLVSPGSWKFFNTYVFKLFMNGMEYVIQSMFGMFDVSCIHNVDGAARASDYTQCNTYGFLSNSIDILFKHETWYKILGLLFAGPLGWVFVLLFIIGFIFYVWAMVKAVITYLMAIIALTLLFIVSPIFISFMLFQETKSFFDGWYKQMFAYAMTAILVMGSVIIFHYWIYSLLNKILGYGVCWKCVVPIKIPVIDYTVCLLYFWLPEGFTNNADITFYLTFDIDRDISYLTASLPFILFSILMFIIFAYAMRHFIDFMITVAHAIAVIPNVSSLTGATSGAYNPIYNAYDTAYKYVKGKGTSYVKRGVSSVTGYNFGSAKTKKSSSKNAPPKDDFVDDYDDTIAES